MSAAVTPLGRRIWLTIHRWIGLGLLIVFAALGITGAALTYPEFFDRLAHPERYPERAATAPLAATEVLRIAGQALPAGDRVAAIRYPAGEQAILVGGQASAAPPLGIGPPGRVRAWLDPADGHVLAIAAPGADFLWTMHATHGHLLLPSWGGEVLAVAGIVLLCSAGTGLWLWWPGLQRIPRALRWRSAASISMNLHRQTGAIIILILILETITGIWLAVPSLFAALIEPGMATGRSAGYPPATTTLAVTGLPIDQAVADAAELVPGGELDSIFLPTEQRPIWNISFRTATATVAVAVPDGGGEPAIPSGRPTGRAAAVESVMMRIHAGDFGAAWRFTVFLSGVVMTLLAVTGLLLWLQGRARRTRGTANS